MADLENLLGQMNGSHLLFVHNTDETTGLDRIDVHVVVPNETNEQWEMFLKFSVFFAFSFACFVFVSLFS